MSPYRKSEHEKQLRSEMNQKFAELKEILCPEEKDESQGNLLIKAYEYLTGVPIDTPQKESKIGKIDKKEKRKDREQERRDKLAIGYESLKNFILLNKIGSPEQRNKLEKKTVLEVIIKAINDKKEMEIQLNIPQQLPTVPVQPIPPINPILLQWYFTSLVNNYLQIQNIPQPTPPNDSSEEETEEKEEEYIHVEVV